MLLSRAHLLRHRLSSVVFERSCLIQCHICWYMVAPLRAIGGGARPMSRLQAHDVCPRLTICRIVVVLFGHTSNPFWQPSETYTAYLCRDNCDMSGLYCLTLRVFDSLTLSFLLFRHGLLRIISSTCLRIPLVTRVTPQDDRA